MWIELKSADLVGLKKYADMVKAFFASDEYYEKASEVFLSEQLMAKGGNQYDFLYDDGIKRACYNIKFSGSYPNPYTGEKGMWKVCDLSYEGAWGEKDKNGVSREALRFCCDSVKEELLRRGITHWYVIFNMDTLKLETLTEELVKQKMIFLQFLNDVQAHTKDIITDTKMLADGKHFVAHYNAYQKETV
jgi:hypothetical protein